MLKLTQLSASEIPHHPIKAVFFDIDGTVLRKDGSYSEATATQIKRLRELGIKVGAATGRPHYATQFLANELGISDFGVFCTGAHVCHPQTGETLIESAIAPDTAMAFLQEARALSVYYEIYSNDGYCVDHNWNEHLTAEHSRHLRIVPSREPIEQWLNTKSIHKFLIAADTQRDAAGLAALEQKFPELIYAYAQFPAFPTWRFASVIAPSACKKVAFERLLNHYQLEAKNLASFGDSASDMIFLQSAGVGVAMGNASDEVKKVARYVTKSVEDDGIAYALSRLITACEAAPNFE